MRWIGAAIIGVGLLLSGAATAQKLYWIKCDPIFGDPKDTLFLRNDGVDNSISVRPLKDIYWKKRYWRGHTTMLAGDTGLNGPSQPGVVWPTYYANNSEEGRPQSGAGGGYINGYRDWFGHSKSDIKWFWLNTYMKTLSYSFQPKGDRFKTPDHTLGLWTVKYFCNEVGKPLPVRCGFFCE